LNLGRELRFRRSTPEDAESFRRCLDLVARERKWLGFLEAPSLEEVEDFLRTDRPIQFLAERGGEVLGWCDVIPDQRPGFRHSGTLGMGVAPGFRGIGIGRKLLQLTLEAAFQEGLSRVELEVFASNGPAIALYERAGFRMEGRKRGARVLDGRSEDVLVMARFRSPEQVEPQATSDLDGG
jgi:RimJ/RimL family protein N-acetyltransferase